MDQTYIWIGTGLIAVASIGVLALMERRRQLTQEARQTAYNEHLRSKAQRQRDIANAVRSADRKFVARGDEAKPVTRPIGRATGPVRSSELRSTDPYIVGGHDSMSLHHPLNPLNPVHHSSFDDCSSRSSGSSWSGSSSSSYDSGSSSSSDSSSSSSCD